MKYSAMSPVLRQQGQEVERLRRELEKRKEEHYSHDQEWGNQKPEDMPKWEEEATRLSRQLGQAADAFAAVARHGGERLGRQVRENFPLDEMMESDDSRMLLRALPENVRAEFDITGAREAIGKVLKVCGDLKK